MIAASRLLGIAIWLLAIGAGFPFIDASRAQTSSPSPIQFFLDQPPTEAQLSLVPQTARDVIIAKVRIDAMGYLLGHLPSGSRLPKDKFQALLEIVELLRGDVAGKMLTMPRENESGMIQLLNVYFGEPRSPQQYTFPRTPDQKSRTYYVVSHLGADQRRRLIGFPLSEQEYQAWDQEWWTIERERARPGARDN